MSDFVSVLKTYHKICNSHHHNCECCPLKREVSGSSMLGCKVWTVTDSNISTSILRDIEFEIEHCGETFLTAEEARGIVNPNPCKYKLNNKYIGTIEKAIRLACNKGETKITIFLPISLFFKKRRAIEEAAKFYRTLGYNMCKKTEDEIVISW